MRLIIIILFLSVFSFSFASGMDYKGVRGNGPEWISFGTGVISCAVEARVEFDGDYKNAIVVNSPSKMGALKKWVCDNFRRRFDLSPISPGNLAVIPGNSITLYSSTTAHDDQDTLIIIPLTPLTMGLEQKDFQKKIQELKKILDE